MQSVLIFGILFLFSTICNQDFTFLGVTGDSPVTVWIIEDLGGECHFSSLLQLSVLDTSAVLLATRFSSYKETDNFVESFQEIHHYPADEVTQQDSSLTPKNHLWSVHAPPRSDSLLAQFSFNANYSAERWNQEKRSEGMILPVFERCSARLLYAHPRGLYINYSIQRAILDSKNKLLVIFTNQAFKGPGLDSMHGFLIYRINV